MSKKRNEPARTVRINRRPLVVAALLAAALGLGVYFLNAYQQKRSGAEALAESRRLVKAGEADLAVRHLNQHLALRPADVEALELRSKLLFDAARGPGQIYEAIKAQEQFLRTDPEAAGGQDARRRLVELYVRHGEFNRSVASSQTDNELNTLNSRYRAAESVARQLIDRGAHDAGAHLLLARALDGLAVPGDQKALNDAVREYRNVLAIEPARPDAAERLAKIYQERLKDLPRAERVADDLLRAMPRSSEVRLVRYRLYARARLDDKASNELEEAIKLSPDDLPVILSAAEHALRRGDPVKARRQIEKIPASGRGDIRVLMTLGLIDFGDERPEEAVDAWRRGLLASSGTNDEVTWWLAFSLIQMGRVSEAKPLMSQYRRLVGDDAPLLRFLEAMLDERDGKPARALAALTRIAQRLDPRWEAMVHIARGRCFEALWDEMKALESYSQAVTADPLAVVPRLSIAKIRLKRRPGDAVDEIERGLSLIPGDPALRVALAGALLRREAIRPAGRRDWADFDRAQESAAAASPNSSAVLLMAADRLALSGREEEAVRFLERTAKEFPRNPAIAVALSEGLSSLGRRGDALEALRRASAPGGAGDLATLRVAQAKALIAMNRGREAREVLVRGVEKLPPADQPEIWITVGQLESARGDADAARRAFAEWARLLPEDPRPRLVLLDLAFEQGDEPSIHARVEEIGKICGTGDVAYRLARAKELLWERDAVNPPPGSRDTSLEEAGQLVEAVLSDAPELPAAQMMRSQVLERQGKVDEAINGYQKAWERGIEAALPRLISLLTQKRRFDALSQLRADDRGTHPQVDMLSAQAFLRLGDTSQASRVAEQFARDRADSAEAFRWQARMLNHLGRIEDAESALRAMAERRPGELEPWLTLLRFQAERKRAEAAADTVAKIKARVKTDPPALLDARCHWAAGDLPAAKTAFEAAVAARPEDIPLRLEAARFYEESERPVEAEAALREVIRLDPKNRPAARQLSVVLSARAGDVGAWERAWAELGPEGAAATSPPEDRFARAVVLSRCPDPARRGQAIGRLEELVADLPARHNVAALARDYLARLLLDANEPARASQVAAVSASRAGDPASIALYARTLIMGKKPEAAEWQLDRLAAVSPGDPREAGLRAQVIWDRSRPLEAVSALESAYRAREDTPGSEVLGREAFRLLAGRGEEASPAAERVGRKLARKNPSWSWMPALVLSRRGKNDEALNLLQTAAQGGAFEDLVETARVAMTIAIESDDAVTVRKVEDVLASVLKAEPNADELIIMVAMLRHIQSRYDEEATLYTTALRHRPENPVILNNLSWVLSEGLHRPDDALKHIETLIKIMGRNAQALDTRGVILTRLGRYPEAIRDLEEAVTREPNALHHIHLARAYSLAGRAPDARKSIERARKVGFTAKDLDPVERAEVQSLMNL